ncbi:hypothetical protein OH77DRAFT_404284 [Trametes cingulata]|nr:hypothetical protein OH77DRAFT_404284 [Trametes cingulata]
MMPLLPLPLRLCFLSLSGLSASYVGVVDHTRRSDPCSAIVVMDAARNMMPLFPRSVVDSTWPTHYSSIVGHKTDQKLKT